MTFIQIISAVALTKILIYGGSLLGILGEVFLVMNLNNLSKNFAKYNFARSELRALGTVVISGGARGGAAEV